MVENRFTKHREKYRKGRTLLQSSASKEGWIAMAQEPWGNARLGDASAEKAVAPTESRGKQGPPH
jgi:hypothetical protein